MKETTIEESNDLCKMSIDELIGNLLNYEMKRKPKDEKTKPKKNIALKMKNEKDNSLMEEEDMSLFARKFNKFLLRSKKK